MLKALLLERFLRHDKVFVAEAHLILGEWKIIVVLRVFVYGLFIRANLPIFPIVLFGFLFIGIFSVLGTVRSVIVSCAGVAILAAAGFRVVPLTPAIWLCFRRVLLCWVFLVIAAIIFRRIYHVDVI